MSREPDWNPDLLLRRYVRHAAAAAPDPVADIARTIRDDRPLPDTVTETDLRAHAAEAELRAMRDRVRHLEQALRAAGRVLQPYLPGNGR